MLVRKSSRPDAVVSERPANEGAYGEGVYWLCSIGPGLENEETLYTAQALPGGDDQDPNERLAVDRPSGME